MMADLNALIIFAKVVEAKSFSEAARRLGMPISTVSRRVSELEDQLGVRLLEIIVREGSMLRGMAVGIAATGLGILVLLTCWGISMFNHDGLAERVEKAMEKQTASLGAAIEKAKPVDRTDEILRNSAMPSFRWDTSRQLENRQGSRE
jgi:DNA-binding transcriptional ArsR family regulator